MQKERDALLAEKSAARSATEGTSGGSREEDKAQLLRERDEALANCKVSHLGSLRITFRPIRFSTCPTESAGAGEPVEEPAETKLHADREQCCLAILSLFTKTLVLVWLSEAIAGAGSGEKEFFHETAGRHRHRGRSREKRESTHDSPHKRGS